MTTSISISISISVSISISIRMMIGTSGRLKKGKVNENMKEGNKCSTKNMDESFPWTHVGQY